MTKCDICKCTITDTRMDIGHLAKIQGKCVACARFQAQNFRHLFCDSCLINHDALRGCDHCEDGKLPSAETEPVLSYDDLKRKVNELEATLKRHGIEQLVPTYRNTIHGKFKWLGTVDVIMKLADQLNYPYFLWNGIVYTVYGVETKYRAADLGDEE